ncbi:S-adenosyl-L-methionine-dependent methyltransferase [Absidia repens]|uniref:S-adenosyl-L-methionine-dependent methyltransferase n=1 Tax=Absidia repens TaxID=90262 RepID=A0A1X2HZA6_9FUNG|nr:S-adenosyl-L-methionine-dependent methyltransferase [Absidia repens]
MGAHHSREIISKEKRRRRKKPSTIITSANNESNGLPERSSPFISSTPNQAHVTYDDGSIDTKHSHSTNQSDLYKGSNSPPPPPSPPPPSPPTSTPITTTSPNRQRNPVQPVRHQVMLSDHIIPLSSLVSISKHIRRTHRDEENGMDDNGSGKQIGSIASQNQHQQQRQDHDTLSAASDEEESPTNPSFSSRSAFYTSSLDSSSSAQTSLTQPSSILHRRLSLSNTKPNVKPNSKVSNSNRSSNSGPVSINTTVNDLILPPTPDNISHPQHEDRHSTRKTRKSNWHYVLKQVFGGNVIAELDPAPQRILDSACGIGLWTWETSQQYKNSDVVGIDINLPDQHSGPWGSSATFKNSIPLAASHTYGGSSCGKNISFIYGDILEPLPFDNDYFGFIHQRGAGAFVPFDYWETLLREFYRILKVDGMVQLVEHDILFNNPGPILSMINEWYRIASDGIGVQTGYIEVMKEKLLSVGFDQVEEQVYDIPIGEWSDDPVKKQQGFLYKEQVKALFKSVQRWWLSETGINQHEYDRVCLEAMDEFEDYNSSVTWKIFTARKPRPCLTTTAPSSNHS